MRKRLALFIRLVKNLRPILDAVLRLFQHGLVLLGTPVLDQENIAVLKQLY